MLLRAIKAAMHCFDHRKNQYLAMAEAIGRFWILYQGKGMSNQIFHGKFKAIVSVVKEHSGNIALHTFLIALKQLEYSGDEEDDEEDMLDIKEFKEYSCKKFLAHCFLKKACKVRYKSLLKGLHKDYLMGRCTYPDTVNAAYNLINGYQDKARQC
eukprot:1979329-Ditylum_brightwellii.AAC.1